MAAELAVYCIGIELHGTDRDAETHAGHFVRLLRLRQWGR
jgi:hypothetical protein